LHANDAIASPRGGQGQHRADESISGNQDEEQRSERIEDRPGKPLGIRLKQNAVN